MRRQVALGAAALVLAGCTSETPAPTQLEVRAPLFAAGGNAGGNKDVNLGTHLTGAEESPARATPAQGQAIFRVNADGTVDFRLIASNIDNITQAHIHCGPPGHNGLIRMWLYPVSGPPGTEGAAALQGPTGPHNGVLASGSFSLGTVTCAAADVGREMPLLEAIRAGLTYVNVHTNNGVAPSNEGPGDFPGGEIRGRIDHASSHLSP
jgi:CHRD domain